MKALVLLNRSAGSLTSYLNGTEVARVRSAFRTAGVDAEVQILAGRGVAERARQALSGGADVVVAGGGDGTIGAVAEVLAGSSRPLGVLPLGTWNHFAKDLGIPLGLDEAVQTIAAGKVRTVDVGEVNGRIFVNNASIGLYPHMVTQRDQQRLRLGRTKWLAMLSAFFSVFRRFPLVDVRLAIGQDSLSRRTPVVFVGNNRYDVSLLALGGRSSLERGELCLYVVRCTGRFSLLKLALRALVGRLDQNRDFDALCLPEFWVATRKRRLKVALDGEVVSLKPPLHFRVRPRSLHVLASPAAVADSV